MDQLRIAFLTIFDARDVTVWSGTPLHMAQALEDKDAFVTFVGPLAEPYRIRRAIKARAYSAFGRQYRPDRDIRVLRRQGAEAARRLSTHAADVVLSPGGLALAYLDAQQPLVMWSDATFAGLVDYYPAFKNLAAETLRNGYASERAAMDRVSLAIFSSNWAARSAQEAYELDDDRIAVVPYGANLSGPRSSDEVRRLIGARPRNECRLLFLAADWERKGGDDAIRIAELCNEMGIPTRLTILGRARPPGKALAPWVEYRGFANKATPEGLATLAAELSGSHFLLLPTKADCTPIVIAEACAFGLPTLATNTGGVAELVHPGRTGFLFSVNDLESYCNAIGAVFGDQPSYENLAMESFFEYRSRLNWKVSGSRVRDLLRLQVRAVRSRKGLRQA